MGAKDVAPFQIKPGEVRNPTGVNQYTYRDDAERDLAAWCKEHGTELIDRLLDDAMKGKPLPLKLALERILPAVTKHEVDHSGSLEVLSESHWSEFSSRLDRLLPAAEGGAATPGNGSGKPPNGSGAPR